VKSVPKALRLAETLAATAERLVRKIPFDDADPPQAQIKLASAVRATCQYWSIVQLLKGGAWEDAQILLRSMIGLLANLRELFSAPTLEELELRCKRFCSFAVLDAQLCRRKDGQYATNPSTRSEINRRMLRMFSEFVRKDAAGMPRLRKDGWYDFEETWSGKKDARLLEQIEEPEEGRTPHKFLYAISSAYVHSGPLALFGPLCLAGPGDPNTWPDYSRNRAEMGRQLTPLIALAAAELLLDILEQADGELIELDPDWREHVPRRLLDAMLENLPSDK
jgi:hypothetical protein